ncbi:MAG: 7-cyano-7-deazaguanine synthase QueC [Opitutae bacterium]|nr:7-cyano-7-deazaguanine synthase QueC [Opitutae bacterium]
MKTVLAYSGGLDSTVLLYHLVAEGGVVSALSVNYGQRHQRELDSARAIATRLGLPHKTIDLSSLGKLLEGCSLTNPDLPMPQGHYAEPSMKATVVPNRNMLFLALAASWAISLGADTVSYAAHSGDHAIYPDCRETFAQALDNAIRLADWREIRLNRPFVHLDKGAIVERGATLGVPFARTWSCYEGGQFHCGRCGTCIERREAFHRAGVEDPTLYASDSPSIDAMIAKNWRL